MEDIGHIKIISHIKLYCSVNGMRGKNHLINSLVQYDSYHVTETYTGISKHMGYKVCGETNKNIEIGQ